MCGRTVQLGGLSVSRRRSRELYLGLGGTRGVPTLDKWRNRQIGIAVKFPGNAPGRFPGILTSILS